MRLIGNDGVLGRVVGNEAAPGVRGLNRRAAMNQIGGPHQGGALGDMQQFSMQALGGENLFQACGVAGSVRITGPQGFGVLRENQIIHAMTARIVKELTGAGKNILKRDPRGGELIRRFHVNKSRVLMAPLLGAILEIETLKRHRIILENIGEEIEDGRGKDQVAGGFEPGVEIEHLGFLVVQQVGRSRGIVMARGVPIRHFDVAIRHAESLSHGFKKTVRRRAGRSPIKDGVAVPTPRSEDLGACRIRDAARLQVLDRARQIGPQKAIRRGGILGLPSHAVQVAKCERSVGSSRAHALRD